MSEIEDKPHIINVCPSNYTIKSSCCKFEFMGILCRHILKVYIITILQNLHNQYMLKHWTRDAKMGVIFTDEKGKPI